MYTRKRYLLVGGQVPRSTRYYQAKQKEKKKLEAAVQKDISQNSKERCFHGHSPTEIPTLESTTLEVFDAALPESQYPSTLNDGDEQVLMLEESAVEALNVSMPLPNNSSSSTDTDDQVGPKQRPLRKKRKVSKQKLRTASKQLSSSEEICSSSDSCPSPASHHSSPERSQTLEDYVGDSVPECVISECESESEVEKKGFPKKKSDPLCPCSDITVDDVLCMTLALGIRHDFTWEAQVDILEMFATVFKDAKIPTTKEKYIQSLNVEERSDIKYQIFCKDCGIYLGERKEKVKAVTCGNCSKSIKVKSAANSFVTLSIRSQIKKFLKDEKFVNNILNYRFKRESKSGVLNDIYDGEVYKRLSEDGGVLSSQYNFSYTIFTDGVRYGKSNKTIWPIYLSINELPYEERGKYLILAAVYAGAKDPNPLYFLQPSITEANELSETGISWVHEGKFVTSLIIPLCFVADSVARHQMLNFQTFHSYFGCTFCYKVSKRERGGQRYALSEPAPDRTDLSWREDLHEVHRRLHDPKIPEKKKSYRGVRGPCALLKLKYFSINHCVVDYMHAILVGCVKTHLEPILEDTRLKMWIGMDNTKDKVGQNHIVKTLDQRIQLIQSNTTIMRELRLVSDFKLWKASEFRSWLLFYFIPCLSGLLKEKYIVHLAMLSKASFLLLQRSITLENIAEANRLFIMYAFYFQKYFGEENMVYNFHLLSHICKCVANFGPIWGHSSFPFESHNRFILQLLKSPFAVAFQIANKFTIYKHFPTLRQELNLNDRVLKFVEKVLDNKKHGKCVLANDNKCYLFGVPEYYRLTEDDKSKMLHCIGHTDFDECFFYQRLKYCKKRYTTQAYSSDKENNDSCAFLKNGQCVLIKHIINIPSVHKVLLFVQKIVVSKRPVFNHSRFSYDSYHKVTRFSEHYFVRVECLEAPCFSVVGSDASYVSRIPYGCTIE